MDVTILKRCNKQTDLKHDTQHTCDCNRPVYVMMRAKATSIKKNYIKTWL